MKTAYAFLCLMFAVGLVTQLEARGGFSAGGRGGGRGGGGGWGRGGGGGWGRSGGGGGGRGWGRGDGGGGGSSVSRSSGSRWSVFESGSKSNSNSPHHTNQPYTGGFFHGFIHSVPYRPSYISGNHYSHSSGYSQDEPQQSVDSDTHKDGPVQGLSDQETKLAAGYAVSKALSNDFLSIFNMVYEISKYPKEIESNSLHSEITFPTTTAATAAATMTATETPQFEQNPITFSSNEASKDTHTDPLASVNNIFNTPNDLSQNLADISSLKTKADPITNLQQELDSVLHFLYNTNYEYEKNRKTYYSNPITI